MSTSQFTNIMAEDKFVWYVTLPTLEEMAACAVSQALWYSFMSRCKLKRTLPAVSCKMAQAFNVDHDYWGETDKEVESLKMAQSVEKLLKETVARVRFNLWKLVEHFSYQLFSEDLERFNKGHGDFGYTKPDFCVWFPNGEVDHQKTAVKMLSLPGISNIHKFALMCFYCMKDKIVEFPLNSLPKKFLKEVYFEAEPLLDYWIHFKKNTVHEISTTGFTSVEALVAFKLENMQYWPAFEYFWHRLTTEEQYTVVRSRFADGFNYDYKGFERVFSLLSASQQRRLLAEIPTQVIRKFSIIMNSPRSTLWVWMHCKDSLNGKQFLEVVSHMLSETKEERTRPLLDIWNTASDQQRNFVAKKVTDEFIKGFVYHCDPPSSAFAFLRQFLTMKDADFRKQLLLKYAPKFGPTMSDAFTMNDILNLCLPDSQDQSKFKSLVVDSSDMMKSCRELVFRGDFRKLDVRLKFYFSDENARRKFQEKLLAENILIEYYMFNMNKWTGLSKFIDEALPQGSLALKKKKRLMLEFASKFPHHNPHGNKLDDMPTMFKIMESVFADDMLKAVKKTCFESFVKRVAKMERHFDWEYYFHENYFLQFVRWSLGDDVKSVIKYQNGKFIDTVFEVVFSMLDLYYKGQDYFFFESLVLDLEKCLGWYAANGQEVKQYKMDKLRTYRQFEFFKSLWIRKDPHLDLLLKFFFGTDQVGMQNFKNTMFK